MNLINITDKLYLDPRHIISVTVKEQWKNDEQESYITLTTAVDSYTILVSDIGNVETFIDYINNAAQED